MFYGEFDYKIDDKGRVPIPPRFRNALKDGVVLLPGTEKCITAYTLTEWRKLSTTLTTSALSRSKMRKLSRALFSSAFSTRLDNQGRVAIPAPLREHAEIADDVVIAGSNAHGTANGVYHFAENILNIPMNFMSGTVAIPRTTE